MFDESLAGKLSSTRSLQIGEQSFPTMYTGHTYGTEGEYCKVCLGGPHDYQIRSTTTTNAAALTWLGNLHEALRKALSLPDGSMLGILYAGGKLYGAHSGASLSYMKSALPDSIEYVAEAAAHPVTRGGYWLSEEEIWECKADNPPLSCAGAKLVSHALAAGRPLPYHMTEIWFDPKGSHGKYKHGAIIESCKTCKELLMALMCPVPWRKVKKIKARANSGEGGSEDMEF